MELTTVKPWLNGSVRFEPKWVLVVQLQDKKVPVVIQVRASKSGFVGNWRAILDETDDVLDLPIVFPSDP